MKKTVLFLLVVALALGGLGYAHAAVSAGQDDLMVYPTLEIGDPGALEGLTASMTFTCGDHLRWHTDYPFGGEAVTQFAYSREPIRIPAAFMRSRMDVWFTGGMSSSVSGGSIPLSSSNYGGLLKAVAAATPQGGSKTMNLRMADHVDYYLPDYTLSYEDGSHQCSESASLYGIISGEYWHEDTGSYRSLMDAFRFPVQEDHIMSVTIEKDDMGRVVSVDLYPENGPELQFLSAVNADGVWFVPIFRDESGAPLPYESPAGHGIYFIPWKNDGIIRYTSGEVEKLTLDVEKARLCFPLADTLQIDHLDIDPDAGTARMLTLEAGKYILTTCDLSDGAVRSRLELLHWDPADPDSTASFLPVEDYLLLYIQGNLALTDAEGETLLLTAPDWQGQTFGGRLFDPDAGDLIFDGETLILSSTAWYREGTFWAAAWRQGEAVFYGEYDCSLMRGNEDWYYSYVSADEYPLTLK